jgi:hypothetical protein
MNDTQPEENPAEQAHEVIAEPVVGIQNALIDDQPFHL